MTALGLHHRILVCCLTAFLYVVLATMIRGAPESHVLVASPDHPRTFWTSGWDENTHYVQWNSAANALEAHVVYSAPGYMDNWNPVLYDQFKARFPGVHLDAKQARLYLVGPHKHQVTIGHLEPGVYGDRVQLEKDIGLEDASAMMGHLDAALVTR